MSDLTKKLQLLINSNFITISQPEPDVNYKFNHEATQESLYASLLHTERRQLHQQIGNTLEKTAKNRFGELNSLLAYHFEKGGDKKQAIKYLTLAAEQAVAAYANQEAKYLYSRALSLLTVDEYFERWQLLCDYEEVLDQLEDRKNQANTLTLLQTLAELMGDKRHLCVTHNRRAIYFDRIGEIDASVQAAQVGLRMARQAHSPYLEAESLNLLSQAAWQRFDYHSVERWAKQALDALSTDENVAGRIISLCHLARTNCYLGYYDQALEYINTAHQYALDINDRVTEALCQYLFGLVYQAVGNYEQATHYFKQQLEISKTIGLKNSQATALNQLGWVAYYQGQYQTQQDYCEQALVIARQIDNCEIEANALSGLGLAASGLNKTQKAVQFYNQALKLNRNLPVAQPMMMFNLSQLAHLTLQTEDPPTAYQYAEEVLDWIANKRVERFWDPFTLYYLNYLVVQANNKPTQAKGLLQAAYNLLQARAEQITTPDLQHSFLNNVAVNCEIIKAWKAID